MSKALTKSQIISLVAEKNTLTKKQAVQILDSIAALAYKHAKHSFTKAWASPNPATLYQSCIFDQVGGKWWQMRLIFGSAKVSGIDTKTS